MANEVTTTTTLFYSDSAEQEMTSGTENFQRSVSTKRPVKHTQNIGTSEEAITLGDGGTIKELYLRNLDATNYVEIKTGTGGVITDKLLPGEDCIHRLGSGM
ncbi:MAG TPA: hypothetical protein VM597_18985, partial [Gemmataceae bacterium]|nr:hypothetical protein [Gemmataceae bacterium]